MRTTTTPETVAELIARQWGDHRPGLKHEHAVLSRHRTAQEAAARAALLVDLLPPEAEPHLGVLLDNTPEFPFWLGAAALAGAAVAGINPTRRGPELARDILHTDCRILVTERAHLPLLRGLDLPGVRILVTDTEEYARLLAPYAGAKPGRPSSPAAPPRLPDAPLLHVRLHRRPQGRPLHPGPPGRRRNRAGPPVLGHPRRRPLRLHAALPRQRGHRRLAAGAGGGASVALRRRFSASRFLDDVRAYEATYFTYVGRAIQYLLATEPRPDDRAHTLRLGFGTEAARWTPPASPSGSGSGWWRATGPPRAAPPWSAPPTPRRQRWAGPAPGTTSRSSTPRRGRSARPPRSTARGASSTAGRP